MGSCQITKNQINLDLIEIIQFCLKIYDLWRHPHPWVSIYGWMGGSCQTTKNQINLDLIKIIQFCLRSILRPHMMISKTPQNVHKICF